jgi:hypothetical protein
MVPSETQSPGFAVYRTYTLISIVSPSWCTVRHRPQTLLRRAPKPPGAILEKYATLAARVVSLYCVSKGITDIQIWIGNKYLWEHSWVQKPHSIGLIHVFDLLLFHHSSHNILCVCVYIYICVYVCVCVCIYVCIYIYIYIYIYICHRETWLFCSLNLRFRGFYLHFYWSH